MIALKEMRLKRKMTQQELARKSGVLQQTIASIETGARANPGVMTLYPLCIVLKCTVDDLIRTDPDEDIKVV